MSKIKKRQRGGRPPILKDRVNVTVSLDREQLDHLEEAAEEFGVSRSEFVRDLIDANLHLYIDMRRQFEDEEIERHRAAEDAARRKKRRVRIVKRPPKKRKGTDS